MRRHASGDFRVATVTDERPDALAESRGDFLKTAFAGSGALVAGGVFLGLPKLAASAPKTQDIRVMNFLLLLEYAQAAFYEEALSRGELRGDLLEFADLARKHEQEHIEALRGRLGKRASKEPKFDFAEAAGNADRFAATAFALEENACASYIGQSGNLSRHLRPTAAGIVAIEARHAAWIRHILGRNPAPNAADPSKTPEQAMRFLRRRRFLTSS
jgi:hypothetical protein